MATCRFCGRPAGFLSRAHSECKKANASAEADCRALATRLFAAEVTPDGFSRGIAELRERNFLSDSQRVQAIRTVFDASVQAALEDGLLSDQEESSIAAFVEACGVAKDDLDGQGWYSRIAKSEVLRDLAAGRDPKRFHYNGQNPFTFRKGEILLWGFAGAQYLKTKTLRGWEGGSRGVSFRVMKGVYYRIGATKGHLTAQDSFPVVDVGLLFVTNLAIHFEGSTNRFKVDHSKIESIDTRSDGIRFWRDRENAKPEGFITGDGWFLSNLLANAQNVPAQ